MPDSTTRDAVWLVFLICMGMRERRRVDCSATPFSKRNPSSGSTLSRLPSRFREITLIKMDQVWGVGTHDTRKTRRWDTSIGRAAVAGCATYLALRMFGVLSLSALLGIPGIGPSSPNESTDDSLSSTRVVLGGGDGTSDDESFV